jgi:hypothetical protein
MAVQLVCVRAFGTYKPGDLAAEVPDDATYSTWFFAPADHPAALDAKARIEAELQALQNGDQE